jgi:hypothetical protein
MSAKIRQQLREPETVEEIEKDIATIREWLVKQPHLPKDIGELSLRLSQSSFWV